MFSLVVCYQCMCFFFLFVMILICGSRVCDTLKKLSCTLNFIYLETLCVGFASSPINHVYSWISLKEKCIFYNGELPIVM